MKTLKFALIAALVTCTMVSFASADGFKSKPVFKKIVKLTISKAVQNPGLVIAMYEQVDKNDVINCKCLYYVADVTYDGNIYRITGTRYLWIRFFRMKGVSPVNAKKGMATY